MGYLDRWKAGHPGINIKTCLNIETALKLLYEYCPYKVNDIFLSTSSANPGNTQYPGTTWVAWGSGRVPVGVGSDFPSVGATGGEKQVSLSGVTIPNHKHSLSVTQYTDGPNPGMSSHSHTGSESSVADSSHTHTIPTNWDSSSNAGGFNGNAGDTTVMYPGLIESDGEHTHSGNTSGASGHTHAITFSGDTQLSGMGVPHNNIQPYIVCYMWKRTA
jgi:microcystin-dependent protein